MTPNKQTVQNYMNAFNKTDHGGLGNDSPARGKAAYTALVSGGTSGFNAVLGGNRSIDGQYDRLEAPGVYWTVSENDPITAPFYDFGKGSQALYRHRQPRARSRWQFPCVASGTDRSNSAPRNPSVVERIRR